MASCQSIIYMHNSIIHSKCLNKPHLGHRHYGLFPGQIAQVTLSLFNQLIQCRLELQDQTRPTLRTCVCRHAEQHRDENPKASSFPQERHDLLQYKSSFHTGCCHVEKPKSVWQITNVCPLLGSVGNNRFIGVAFPTAWEKSGSNPNRQIFMSRCNQSVIMQRCWEINK